AGEAMITPAMRVAAAANTAATMVVLRLIAPFSRAPRAAPLRHRHKPRRCDWGSTDRSTLGYMPSDISRITQGCATKSAQKRAALEHPTACRAMVERTCRARQPTRSDQSRAL